MEQKINKYLFLVIYSSFCVLGTFIILPVNSPQIAGVQIIDQIKTNLILSTVASIILLPLALITAFALKSVVQEKDRTWSILLLLASPPLLALLGIALSFL